MLEDLNAWIEMIFVQLGYWWDNPSSKLITLAIAITLIFPPTWGLATPLRRYLKSLKRDNLILHLACNVEDYGEVQKHLKGLNLTDGTGYLNLRDYLGNKIPHGPMAKLIGRYLQEKGQQINHSQELYDNTAYQLVCYYGTNSIVLPLIPRISGLVESRSNRLAVAIAYAVERRESEITEALVAKRQQKIERARQSKFQALTGDETGTPPSKHSFWRKVQTFFS